MPRRTGHRDGTSLPGTFAYTPAAGTVLDAVWTRRCRDLHADRHDRLRQAPPRRRRSTSAQAGADDHLGQPRRHHLRHGPGRYPAGCDGDSESMGPRCPGPSPIPRQPGPCWVPGLDQASERDLHADRHHRLHQRHRVGDDQRRAGDADPHLGQPRRHHLRHGPGALPNSMPRRQESMARCPGPSPIPRQRDGAGCGSGPGVERDLHAHRHDRLHQRHRDGDDRRRAGDADDHVGQPRRHHLRHGPRRYPTRCHGDRNRWDLVARDLRLYTGSGDGAGCGSGPGVLHDLHAHRHHRLHQRHRDGDD